MKATEFLALPEVQRTLDLAQKTSGLPLSIHAMEGDEEGIPIFRAGGCAYCAFVSSLPGGKAACRASRAPTASRALRRGKPVAMLCHAGLSVITFPLHPELRMAASLGPFIPDHADVEIEHELREALHRLDPEPGRARSLPSSADIRRLPASVPSAAAEWLATSLKTLWQAHAAPMESASPAEVLPPPERKGQRIERTTRPRFAAGALLICLLGGNSATVRRILMEALEAESGQARGIKSSQGLRAESLVVQVLEMACRAGIDTTQAHAAHLAESESLRASASAIDAVKGATRILRPLQAAAARSTLGGMLARLDAAVASRLPGRVTLDEVAKQLGETPSAITHRLQRKFGFSYSDYVNRLRIERAKQLLRSSQLSATKIAERVGIHDQSNFSKVFRRHEGMTPSEYRARFGKP